MIWKDLKDESIVSNDLEVKESESSLLLDMLCSCCLSPSSFISCLFLSFLIARDETLLATDDSLFASLSSRRFKNSSRPLICFSSSDLVDDPASFLGVCGGSTVLSLGSALSNEFFVETPFSFIVKAPSFRCKSLPLSPTMIASSVPVAFFSTNGFLEGTSSNTPSCLVSETYVRSSPFSDFFIAAAICFSLSASCSGACCIRSLPCFSTLQLLLSMPGSALVFSG